MPDASCPRLPLSTTLWRGDMSSSVQEFDLIIKVKYGDTLRRFRAYVHGYSMDVDMVGLQTMIRNFFKFGPDDDFTLTYIDSDNDSVTLVDDDDLRDAAVFQRLNPLRISVSKNTATQSLASDAVSQNGNAAPMRLPQAQTQHTYNSAVEPIRTVQGALRDALLNVIDKHAAKATSSSPLLGDLLECAIKLGLDWQGPAIRVEDVNMPSNNFGDGSTCSKDSCGNEYHGLPAGHVMTPNFSAEIGNDIKKIPMIKPEEHTNDVQVGIGSSHVRSMELPAQNSGGSTDFLKYVGHNDIVSQYVPTVLVAPNSVPAAPLSSAALPAQKNKQSSCDVRPYMPPACFRHHINGTLWSHGPPGTSEASLPGVYLPAGNTYPQISSQRDSMLGTFHRGVQCDGCGMLPIVGPRFKSKMKEDYDLCNTCLLMMGNEADYTRIERPIYSCPWLSKEFNSPHFAWYETQDTQSQFPGLKQSRLELGGQFIQDVTVSDGTLMAPATPFTKIWRMRNDGTIAWPPGTALMWTGGVQLGKGRSIDLEIPLNGFPVGEELDIAVDLEAPSIPGQYFSYWKLTSPSGQAFGQSVWVLIQVDVSHGSSLGVSLLNKLNLNLPPDCSSEQKEENLIDVNPEPVDIECGQHSGEALEKVKPLVSLETDLQLNASNEGTDLSGPLKATAENITKPPSMSSEKSDSLEEMLLKELEQMGFRHIDLNKEVLRKNKYDFESCVDELCTFAEWDPILDELHEMGFSDRQMNKRLLIKNGGSIKRVVLDLIAGVEGLEA